MQNAPTMSRNFKYDGEWKTLSLTEDEIELIREYHRDQTIKTMKQCIKDVMEEMPQIVNLTQVACKLFEARTDKFFTLVVRALEDKTRKARDNGGIVVEEERVYPSSNNYDNDYSFKC